MRRCREKGMKPLSPLSKGWEMALQRVLVMNAPRSRALYVLLAGLTVLAGLVWRSRFLPLTPFLFKYGGDALWSMMAFFGFGFLFSRLSTGKLAALSLVFAWAVEFSQLYRAPWLDAIRATRVGHLVLGSTFNWPDLPAYAVGILAGVIVELTVRRAEKRVWL